MITIVGLGAIGSHAALAMRNQGELLICDFDHVEAKNTQAQFYAHVDTGRTKVEAMADILFDYWNKDAAKMPHKVDGQNARFLVKNKPLILDCTDNIAARQVLIDACLIERTPLLHGAMSADGTFGQVVWSEQFTPDQETPGQVTCEDGENLPFHVLMGAQMAICAQQFLKAGVKRSVQITPNGIFKI